MKFYFKFKVIVFMLICIGQQLSAQNISSNLNSGCLPLGITFQAPLVPAVSWEWDFGDGNTSTLQNPVNIYQLEGTYSVSVKVTNSNNISTVYSQIDFIEVYPFPNAGFTASDTNVCQNQSISFTNTAVNAHTYIWDFGDGNFSNSTNPTHSYSSAGKYTVKMMAISQGGCSDAKEIINYITVKPSPTANFSANQTHSCYPTDSFTFINRSSGASSYLWDFGNNTTSTTANPVMSYNSTGTFSVSLTAFHSNGCSSEISKNNYINVNAIPSPVISVTNALGCAPFTTTFSAVDYGFVSWEWNFGNGDSSKLPNPTHTFPAGNHQINLKVKNAAGCTATSNQNIISKPLPDANFTVENGGGCNANQKTFVPANQGHQNYLWIFGTSDTSTAISPQYTFTDTGWHQVKLIVTGSNGCTNFLTKTEGVYISSAQPSISANAITGCAPLNVQFQPENVPQAIRYEWWFGNGSRAFTKNASHTFDSTGNYTITLIAVYSATCIDTIVKNQFIKVTNPAANVPAKPAINVCAPYYYQAVNPVPDAVSWLWNFGDGTTSTLENPSHVYTSNGTFKVSLSVILNNGCKAFVPYYQSVILDTIQPLATIIHPICPGDEVEFIDETPGAVAWLWNFGDGKTSTKKEAIHNYTANGTYSVSLTVTLANGCQRTVYYTDAVTINTFFASILAVNQNNSYPLTVHFSSPSFGASSWNWNFGDSNTSSLQAPQHVYLSPGPFNVTLQVTDGICIRTLTATIDTINGKGGNHNGDNNLKPPVTNVPKKSIQCAPLMANFTDQTQDAISWNWDFGDGNTSTLQNPQHLYQAAGTFFVTVEVHLTNGSLINKAVDTFYLKQPVPAFSVNTSYVCPNIKAEFTNQSTGNYTYLYSFGNGKSSTKPNPTHYYPYNKLNYFATLTVTDTLGCKGHTGTIIKADAGFEIESSNWKVCDSGYINFTTAQAYPGYTYAWELNSQIVDTGRNVNLFFGTEGTHHVRLRLTDSSNCHTWVNMPHAINVYSPKPTFNIAKDVFCKEEIISFNNTSNFNGSWNWDFAGKGTSGTKSPEFSFSQAGEHLIILTGNQQGCTGTASKIITISSPVVDFTISNQNKCFPIAATFEAVSQDAVTWYWNYENQTSALNIFSHIFPGIPQSPIKLTVTDSFGCKSSIAKPFENYNAATLSASTFSGCTPLDVDFSLVSANAVKWHWNFGDGGTSNHQNPKHQFKASGEYRVSAIVTYASGCSDTIYVPNMIRATQPEASFSVNNTFACAPSYLNFIYSGSDSVKFSWTFGDGSVSEETNPSNIYVNPGIYDVSLTVTDKNGCTNTLLKEEYITLSSPEVKFSTSSNGTCAPITHYFNDESKNAVSWFWSLGNGASSFQQNTSHTYTVAGSYEVMLIATDTAGCISSYKLPGNLQIYEQPVASFTADTLMGCIPFSPKITNTSLHSNNFKWLVNGIEVSGSKVPQHVFKQAGNYTLQLIAKGKGTCTDTSHYQMNFQAFAPEIPELLLESNGKCVPASLSFSALPAMPNYVYEWDIIFNEEATNQQKTIEHSGASGSFNAIDAGVYDAVLYVLSDKGCRDTVYYPLDVTLYSNRPTKSPDIKSVSWLYHGTLEISWEGTTCTKFSHYNLLKRDNKTLEYETIKKINQIRAAAFLDNDLLTDTESYSYKLQLVDVCDISESISKILPHHSIVLFAEDISGEVQISWNAYGHCDVGNYEIYRTLAGQPTELLAVVDGNTTSYLDNTSFCPSTYTYQVKAIALCGKAYYAWSNPSDVLPDVSGPDLHVNVLFTTVINDEVTYTEWQEPAEAANWVTSYSVFRSDDNSNFSLVGKVPATQLNFVDTEARVHNQNYYYKVEAENKCFIQTTGSNSNSIHLEAVQEKGNRLIKWNAYEEWEEGVEHYVIEKLNEAGEWELYRIVKENLFLPIIDKQ